MDNKLTGGAKAGYLLLGFFLPLLGLTLIFATNKDKPTLAEAMKFGIFGAWSIVAFGCLLYIVLISVFGIALLNR
jgi:hypothetical protein